MSVHIAGPKVTDKELKDWGESLRVRKEELARAIAVSRRSAAEARRAASDARADADVARQRAASIWFTILELHEEREVEPRLILPQIGRKPGHD